MGSKQVKLYRHTESVTWHFTILLLITFIVKIMHLLWKSMVQWFLEGLIGEMHIFIFLKSWLWIFKQISVFFCVNSPFQIFF